ncbi:hypothetical protein ACFQ9Q_42420 [Streptomyces virginiae]|uniref:hypothetical protein n=1 Tax=Streptomyces virginiae TaxID=1961 RepID=UPI003694894A
MRKYSFAVEEVADTLNLGETTSVRGTLKAPSVEAARTAVEKSLRSRGFEATGSITITPK